MNKYLLVMLLVILTGCSTTMTSRSVIMDARTVCVNERNYREREQCVEAIIVERCTWETLDLKICGRINNGF